MTARVSWSISPNDIDRLTVGAIRKLNVGLALSIASDLRRAAIDEQFDAVDEAAVI